MRLNVSPSFMKTVINDKQWNNLAPMHSSLGILDKVVRTTRDMTYNMKVGNFRIDPLNKSSMH
ncbi:hypothetical protein M9Y10_037154 [Tritrichomonas musculus]|uniref:Uncharacterized protein n=1 Tax=Tritrichomonas musculus TaxID=1915356 RepID=A0ABR2GT96_9EUKA